MDLIRQLKQLRRDDKEQEKRLNQQRNELARLETRLEMLDSGAVEQCRWPKGLRCWGSWQTF
jgi:archaellum component FlaC